MVKTASEPKYIRDCCECVWGQPRTFRDMGASKKTEALLFKGVEVVGGTAGVFVGLLIGGPIGSLMGAAASPVIIGGLKVCVAGHILEDLSRSSEWRFGVDHPLLVLELGVCPFPAGGIMKALDSTV